MELLYFKSHASYILSTIGRAFVVIRISREKSEQTVIRLSSVVGFVFGRGVLPFALGY